MATNTVDYNYYTGTSDNRLPYYNIYTGGGSKALSAFDVAGDVYGGFGSITRFDATRTPSVVKPLELLFEDLRTYKLEAAVAGSNPTLSGSDPQSGMTMLDAAMMSATWPFNNSLGLGGAGWQNVAISGSTPYSSNATSPYTLSSVPSSSTDYNGFYILNGYGSTWHTLCFWAEVMHGMNIVLQSPYATVVSPHYGITYAAMIANFAPKMRDVIYWRNFGGTVNYASPPAPNRDGSYTFGPLHAGDLSHNSSFAHRQFSAAYTCLMCYLLNGSSDPALWWLYNYYLDMGFAMIRTDGSTVENGGYDLSYSATTLYYLDWLYCYDPGTNTAALYNALYNVAAWQASRITAQGGVNCYGNARCNPFEPTTGQFAGLLTGQPIVCENPSGPLPYVFQYAGETTQGSGHTHPKGPDYVRIMMGLGQAGAIIYSVTGNDFGYQALAALVSQAMSTVYVANPVPIAPPTPPPPPVPTPPTPTPPTDPPVAAPTPTPILQPAYSLGSYFAKSLAYFRSNLGQTMTWLNNPTANPDEDVDEDVSVPLTIACTRTQLQRAEIESMISGLNIGNSANADFWRIYYNPLDINNGSGPFPQEGDLLSWDDHTISDLTTWKVVDAGQAPVQGVYASVRLLVYRESASTSNSVAADDETGAGNRKDYTPVANPYQGS